MSPNATSSPVALSNAPHPRRRADVALLPFNDDGIHPRGTSQVRQSQRHAVNHGLLFARIAANRRGVVTCPGNEKPRREGRGSDVCSLRRSENSLRVAQTPDPRQARRGIAAARLRRQRLIEHLHRLDPSPLGHFIHEVEVVRALGGDQFASSLRCIDGGEP